VLITRQNSFVDDLLIHEDEVVQESENVEGKKDHFNDPTTIGAEHDYVWVDSFDPQGLV